MVKTKQKASSAETSKVFYGYFNYLLNTY